MAQLPEPPAGYHYVPKVGDIVYNPDSNDWSYDMNFRLVADESEDERIRKELLAFLDTLEQQEKNVDLEKEIEAYFKDWSINSYDAFFNEDGYKVSMLGIKNIARHFYELGKNAK